jgi:uncharacterized iron-regulated membrane protein
MRKRITLLIAALMMALTMSFSGVAFAKITTTTTQTNGGGNEPKGEANGVPTTTVATNPADHEPPGQQP